MHFAIFFTFDCRISIVDRFAPRRMLAYYHGELEWDGRISLDAALTDAAKTAESEEIHVDDEPAPRRRRKSTSHLKDVPQTLDVRETIRTQCNTFMKGIDSSKPLSKKELEELTRKFLAEHDYPEKYLGFVMVLLGNAFWRRQFLATPFERRMLLLPHCLKHADGCPADYDEFGLDCERCGACSIADYKKRAEELGYKVLVAEGSPVVLRIIVEGYVDGILGVACLNVLEKAIDKVLLAGVPSYAVPLHSGNCKNTTLDESWIWEVLDVYEPLNEQATRSYVPLMRSAAAIFEDRFEELLPATKKGSSTAPLNFTDAVARDWLKNGGKRFRPFMTLAAYHAVAEDTDAVAAGSDTPVFGVEIGRIAMAIEAFHKASLVHDDIQDDDLYRYGRETLHRTHGLGPAINIGDYLIGLGYKLVSESGAGTGVVADVSAAMAHAHLRLCDGQGAEMAWTNDPASALATDGLEPIDALQIYALKTSPAFEAALISGLRLAGPVDEYREPISQFARQLGVGFQILNDLDDWRGSDSNKVVSGQDASARRPTVLLALALKAATIEQRGVLTQGLDDGATLDVTAVRKVYEETGAFERADALVDKCRSRAEAIADEIQPEALRSLLYYLVDTVLAASEENGGEPEGMSAIVPLELRSSVTA